MNCVGIHRRGLFNDPCLDCGWIKYPHLDAWGKLLPKESKADSLQTGKKKE